MPDHKYFTTRATFLIREPFTQLPTSVPDFSSFESSSVLCNYLIRSYQSSISIVLHLRRLILNHSLSSSMTSVPFSPPLQLHPMNLSSPVTLTFISIILQTLSPLSFYLFSLLLILVNMSTSLRMIKITLDLVITSSDTSLASAVSCTHWSPSDHFPVFTKLSINLSLIHI